MPADSLDAGDQVKLDTWFEVMRLLRHYRDAVHLPEYQLPTGLVLPSDRRNARERRDRKLATLSRCEKALEAKWSAAVGLYWQSMLDPND